MREKIGEAMVTMSMIICFSLVVAGVGTLIVFLLMDSVESSVGRATNDNYIEFVDEYGDEEEGYSEEVEIIISKEDIIYNESEGMYVLSNFRENEDGVSIEEEIELDESYVRLGKGEEVVLRIKELKDGVMDYMGISISSMVAVLKKLDHRVVYDSKLYMDVVVTEQEG